MIIWVARIKKVNKQFSAYGGGLTDEVAEFAAVQLD